MTVRSVSSGCVRREGPSGANDGDILPSAQPSLQAGDGISREKRMIRLTYAAMAGLIWWLPSAAAQTAPTSAGPAPAATIEELVLANRILNDRGVLDAYGHVSIRHPTNPNRYLMARAIAPG